MASAIAPPKKLKSAVGIVAMSTAKAVAKAD
jgi:hypothetical protein